MTNEVIKELEEEIKNQKELIYMRELGNDMYYTYGSYREDERYLRELEAKLLEEKNKLNK